MVAEVQTKHSRKFGLEGLDLVREEDGRRAEGPPRVDNTLEEGEIQLSGSVVRKKLSAKVAQSDKVGERTVFDSSERS